MRKSYDVNLIFGITPASLAILLSLCGIVFLGAVVLYGLENAELPFLPDNIFTKHIVFLCISLIACFLVRSMNYLRIGRYAYLLFVCSVFLLGMVLFFGWVGRYVPIVAKVFPNINGSYRWIRFGIVQVQPSEFFKIVYVLVLARYLRYKSNVYSLRALLGLFLFTLVPIVLILFEPDLGPVMLLLPVLLIILFSVGVKGRDVFIMVVLMILSAPGLFFMLKPYQRARIAGVFIQSESVRKFLSEHKRLKDVIYPDKRIERWYLEPEGYQLYHSKMAIGSGGMTGVAMGISPFFTGKRRFPHCHNDFIFAMIVQRFGVLGGVSLILLYFILLVGLAEIASRVAEPFGKLIVIGVMAIISVQASINIAMTLGLMPITGITLPFVSYGGSSLLTYFVLIGLAGSVDRINPAILSRKPFETGRAEEA